MSSASITASEHAGVTDRFASDNNKRRFHADPLTYTVTDDRLYLCYNGEHGNTKPQWEADEQGMKVAADARWAQGDLLPF